MTDKTFARDASGNLVKMPGWFSWRHPTRDAHDEAVARYKAEHGPEARRRKAAERQAAYDGQVREFAADHGLRDLDEARQVMRRQRREDIAFNAALVDACLDGRPLGCAAVGGAA